MKRGDMVRVKKDSSYGDVFDKRGLLGRIVTTPERTCIDWHKSSYETLCTVEFGPGDRVEEVDVDDLEPVDSVSQLAELGRFLPTEKDIGRGVVYVPQHGGTPEDGVITSMNDRYVFVQYKGDFHSKATNYSDLRWLVDIPDRETP